MIVEKKRLKLKLNFTTQNGFVLKNPEVAYEEYGENNMEVILITHGGLSSMHAAGIYQDNHNENGWWDEIIGPNKVFDTNKYRIICANALGSMYGTCSPITTNIKTGNIYGNSFPTITFVDQVKFFKQFLDELGIDKLYLAAGVSMGSMHNLQLAALYPDFVGGVISVATAGRMPPSGIAIHNFISNTLKLDAAYNNGNYKKGTHFNNLIVIHQMAKIYYTHERVIKSLCWDSVQDGPKSQEQRVNNINQYLEAGIEQRIKNEDPNCIIRILHAINTYNLGLGFDKYETGVQKIKCPVLLVNINTDQEFPPHWAQEVADIINDKNPSQAEVKILDSPWGHIGCLKETDEFKKIFPVFMKKIEKIL